jgi:nucleoside-diphosphate-sugar epimerase
VVSDLRGQIFEVDLARPRGVEKVLEAFRPAIVFNLAGYGVDQTERDETLSKRLNGDLPLEICQAAAIWKDESWQGQHIVHVGSALEYGVVGGDLQEDGPAQPTTVYGRSKLRGTQQVIESCGKLGMRGLTARLFTVYGPGEHATRLLPSLIRAANTRQRLDLTEGAQLRDFTYVEDVAEGLLRLGVSPAEHGLVVNLATGSLSSVRSFVEIAARLLEIPAAKLGFGALATRGEEMRHDPVSVLRMREMTGFVPSVSIETGVRRTLAGASRSPACQ